MAVNKLRCHFVDCDNECIHVGPGSEQDPYGWDYFCDAHHKEVGRVAGEVYPWDHDLSREQAEKMIESRPLLVMAE